MSTGGTGWAAIVPAVFLAAASATFFAAGAQAQADSPNDLFLTVGKSALVTSDKQIERISVGYGDIAEASAVGPNEVIVNGIAPGSTTLIVFQQGGGRLFFDVNVHPNRFLANARLDDVRAALKKELPNQEIVLTLENDSVFLRGTAKDLVSVTRAVAMAATLGKVVNLLYVEVPPHEAQILLKVRFLSIDRTLSTQLGMNIFSTGTGNTVGSTTTNQFPAPTLPTGTTATTPGAPFTFSNLLNIFLYRKDLNLGATIQALEQKGVAQVLAEPNVLTEDGRQGSFLAGGEFPVPVVQGGSGGVGASITIQYREFGVRLNFIPTITPSGSIRLQVAPEVSALDFTNAITISGFSIPALTTRKVRTDVELDEGQSFAIGGLLDKTVTDTFSKVPFIGDIPILGTFFKSKSTSRTNTELVVIVTPEIVRPIPAGTPPMTLPFPRPFLNSGSEDAVMTPSIPANPAAAPGPVKSIPAETLIESLKKDRSLDLSGSIGGKTPGTASEPGAASQPAATSPANPPQ
jgi:pilus assembly protein CpaC